MSIRSIFTKRSHRAPHMLLVNAALSLAVWAVWALVFGDRYAAVLAEHWPVGLAMVFGSLVGGGTSEGGGAVGFPVLTKVLGIPADRARLFTFAIQSIGMVTASLSIVITRVKVIWPVLRWGALPAMLGGVVSVVWLAPLVPLKAVRVLFTAILAALAVGLIVQHTTAESRYKRTALSRWTGQDRSLVVLVGLLGGLLSGMAGVGENTLMFILLVLYFRVCEKVSTPTTVILMSLVSLACFVTHVLVKHSFTGVVAGYWIAAAPIVAVGAPLGAFICTKMNRATVRMVVLVLIAVEVVSTLLLVPLTPPLIALALGTLLVALAVCLVAVKSTTHYQGDNA